MALRRGGDRTDRIKPALFLRRRNQPVELAERIEQRAGSGAVLRSAAAVARHAVFFVLVVVAIDAEQFPVAAVGRIVVVVVVLVVDRQFLQPGPLEFPPAARAHVRKQLQRPFAVALRPLRRLAPQLRQDPRALRVRQRLLRRSSTESRFHACNPFNAKVARVATVRKRRKRIIREGGEKESAEPGPTW